jgi:eukaryotic-like serine/threonine-protein kinase
MPSQRAPSSRPVPPRVGRYEVLLPIASGGMATVYLARSQGARGFTRDVALKLTHTHLKDTSEFAAVLLEEARIASRIKHRNVVSILDVGEDPLGLFLVMDYVEGDTLGGLQRAALARSEWIPPAIGVRILLDALAGLHAAHDLTDEHGKPMGVVHRDFSPQNILIGLDGVAQLADFGIAKAADRGGQTDTGVIKGKVAYMSPEHARSEPIDRRADVWSAGVVAWETFAGRRLHPSDRDGLLTLLKIVSERPPLLRSVVETVPEEVEAVVARALDPKLDLRCESAAMFARDLGNAFGLMGRLAEHDEVAAYVRRVSGPKLEKRREQVKGALLLRSKMAALAEASVTDSSLGTPVSKQHASRSSPPAGQGTGGDLEPATAPQPAETDIDVTVASTPSLLSQPTSLTETSSTSDARRRSMGGTSPEGISRLRWLAGAIGLAAAASLVAFLMGRGAGHSADQATTAPPPPPSATTATEGNPEKVAEESAPPSAAPVGADAAVAPPTTQVLLHASAKVSSPPPAPRAAPAAAMPRPAASTAPRKGSDDLPPNPFARPHLAPNPFRNP